VTGARRGTDLVPAWSLAVIAMITVQIGAALSTYMFESVGVGGTAWLRLTAGGLIFLAIARPRFKGTSPRDYVAPLLLGIVTALMTIAFLYALELIPLGTTVAIEFLGPLSVAVARSGSRRNLIWPVLALAGVLCLTQPWKGEINLLGVFYAALAGTGWALYILMTQHVGDTFDGLQGLALSIPVAAVVSAFFGVPQAWGNITVSIVVASVALAVLMPVIPFSLELLALRRLTAASFGTLMALEPAIATAVGGVVLKQVPSYVQVAGVALVVVAGIGAERAGHRDAKEQPHFEVPGTA